MTDDLVTRLRNSFTTKDYPMLKDHCESCAIPKEFGGHWGNCLYDQAADEIERLRTLLDKTLERENKDNKKQLEIVRKVEADRDRWAKWGEHVFICPNKGINPCRECVSPATSDAMSRLDKGGEW